MMRLKQFGYKRIVFVSLGSIGLFLVYFFQDYLNFYAVLAEGDWTQKTDYTSDFKNVEMLPFVINKLSRYLLNDLFSIAIIYGLFHERKYLHFAFVVLFFGLIFLLPVYLFLYLAQPVGFSSLLGHMHRLVLNPVLMMLLIPAFFYQKKIGASKGNG